MDPLTLTAAIVSLSWKAFEIGKEFNDLRLKYKEADATIDAICIEAEVVHVSLSRVRRLFENGAPTRPKSDELYMIFDTAVTGCDAVLSCLNEEVKKLKASASQSGTFGWKVRAKFIWKEEAMADLLNKLRGQRGAISLLFQSLQMESLSEIHHLLSDRAADFNQYEQDTNHLREKYPDIKISESVLGMQRKPFSIFGDDASAISTTEFCFDDEIVSSAAYRRALSAAHQAVQQHSDSDRVADSERSNDGRDELNICEIPWDAPPSYALPMTPDVVVSSSDEAEPASKRGYTATLAIERSSELLPAGAELVVHPPRASSLRNQSVTPHKPQFERKDSADSDPLVAAMDKARISFKRNDSVLPTDGTNKNESLIDEGSSESDSEIDWEKYVSRRPPIPSGVPIPDEADLPTQSSGKNATKTPRLPRKPRREPKPRKSKTRGRKSDVVVPQDQPVSRNAAAHEITPQPISTTCRMKAPTRPIVQNPSSFLMPTASNMTVSDATRLLRNVQARAAEERKLAREQRREAFPQHRKGRKEAR